MAASDDLKDAHVALLRANAALNRAREGVTLAEASDQLWEAIGSVGMVAAQLRARHGAPAGKPAPGQ